MPITQLLRARLNFALSFTVATSFVALSLQLAAAQPPQAHKPGLRPDFGPNVLIFSPSMPSAEIQAQIDKVYAIEQHSEFGAARYALLFLPGEYHVDIPVGFYTEVMGLGATPNAVHITGNVHSDASLPRNNATCTFWRAVEGFSVTPTGGTMQWAVSQAVPFRRMHVLGDLVLHQKGGWASGGWMSDSLIDGNVGAGPQQQWISRNSEWGSWTGANWNMVFVGIPHPPAGEWPTPDYTKVERTPIVREKPFLVMDSRGDYGPEMHRWSVIVPELRTNSQGITWHGGSTPGRNVPLSSFYIAQPGRDSAATLNAQLAKGKNLLLTPGIYDIAEPLRVTRPNTMVLGLGFATLRPTSGNAIITTADVDGIDIAGILFDAGQQISPVLVEVGPEGSHASHAKNPIFLHDVFFRDGGAGPGSVKVNLQVNSNDTIIDHTWIWRADHGKDVGWTRNLSNNGLVVNGNNVTAYGLFVEHHQQFQVLWNGNHGRTYFYQSEIPYDPPDQPSFTSAPGTNGWASYKVADKVTTHEAWGLGIYSVFRHPNITLSRAIEVPVTPGVRFHHMITVALDNLGEISNVIDDKGGPTHVAPGRVEPKVDEFPK
jgi:hypothetical protein